MNYFLALWLWQNAQNISPTMIISGVGTLAAIASPFLASKLTAARLEGGILARLDNHDKALDAHAHRLDRHSNNLQELTKFQGKVEQAMENDWNGSERRRKARGASN